MNEQEQFEKWFKTTKTFTSIDNLLLDPFQKRSDGHYIAVPTHLAYEAWQARAELGKVADGWVLCSDRCPNDNDSDECFQVWGFRTNGAIQPIGVNALRTSPWFTHWCPKPETIKPTAPKVTP